MSRECRECDKYSSNQAGCWVKGICLADMLDDRTPHWNRKLPPDHECHRKEARLEAKKRCRECGSDIDPLLFGGALCPNCGARVEGDSREQH